ncbi:MAG TPA: hypothetical protein VK629_17545 [Steroidobacteraceae bacterium]|nr:hypothetical protein [Steroidobacteraceae bacterium]
MIMLPSMAVAAVMVYWLSGYFAERFSQNVTSVIDLILFVTIFVATHTFLKKLRDG